VRGDTFSSVGVCPRDYRFLSQTYLNQPPLPDSQFVCPKSEYPKSMPYQGYGPEVIRDWLIGGVDFNLAGNGGPTCSDFTPSARMYFEFIVGVVFAGGLMTWAYK